MRKSSKLKLFKTIAIQLAVSVVFFEILSTFLVHGFWGIGWGQKTDYYKKASEKSLSSSAWNLDYKAHPYFGFVLEDGKGNNYNFLSQYDFPVENGEDELVIGLFGGSVAEGIGKEFDRNSNYYQEYVKTLLPEWRGKKVRFVNLALGGYRQPQQFFVASYFFKMIDVALFLEGANEMSGNPYPMYPLDFPKLTARFFNKPGEDYWKKKKIKIYRDIYNRWIEFAMASKPLRYSSSCYMLLTSYERWASQRVVRLSADMVGERAKGQSKYYPQSLSEKQQKEALIENWRKYFKLSHTVFKANDTKFISFIQPSQYVKNAKKSFTEKEMEEAVDQSGRYNVFFAERIVDLAAAARALKAQGFPVCDFTALFKQEREQIYIDKFCHVNNRGEKIILEAMLTTLANAMNAKTKGFNCYSP